MNVAAVLSSARCAECGKKGSAARITLRDTTRIDVCLTCFLAMKMQIDLISEGLDVAPRPPRLELAHLRDLVERFADRDTVLEVDLNAATVEWALFNKIVRRGGTTSLISLTLTPKGIYLLGREANS